MAKQVTCETCGKGLCLADAVKKEVGVTFGLEGESKEWRAMTLCFCSELCNSELCRWVDDCKEHLVFYLGDEKAMIQHLVKAHGEARAKVELAISTAIENGW
jgi:hypothetical protein